MPNLYDDLARTGKALMFKEALYGLFLLTLNKTKDNNIPTAGVSKNGINCQLSVNEDFWFALPDSHKIGVLKHELLHIVMFHLLSRERYPDKILFNVAADLEINQYIESGYLPEWTLSIHTNYKEYNLKPLQGTKYYYDELDKQRKTNPKLNQQLIAQGSGNGPAGHITWDDFTEGMSDAEKELVKKQVDHQMKEIVNNQKNRGLVPGELKAYIDNLFKINEPVFDWKAYLRRFMGSSDIIYTKKTRKKPNKRYPDNPALKIKTKNHILCAIDTSGSVSDAELADFFSEIHHIWKTGNKVTIAQCDADIHDIREYKGKFDGRITGRGGTRFDDPIDHFNKNQGTYTTLIYLTDGYAPAPVPKPWKPMMWVMSKSSQPVESFGEFPGYKIKIPADK